MRQVGLMPEPPPQSPGFLPIWAVYQILKRNKTPGKHSRWISKRRGCTGLIKKKKKETVKESIFAALMQAGEGA